MQLHLVSYFFGPLGVYLFYIYVFDFVDAIRIGLSLVINIQQDQYSSDIGNTAGIVVLALPQNLMPFPEDHGVLVSPGYDTEVALSLV